MDRLRYRGDSLPAIGLPEEEEVDDAVDIHGRRIQLGSVGGGDAVRSSHGGDARGDSGGCHIRKARGKEGQMSDRQWDALFKGAAVTTLLGLAVGIVSGIMKGRKL